jgi:hypothetical protein
MDGEFMTTLAVAEAMDTLLVDVNDGAMPTHKHYFDHVWVGAPKRIPMGDKTIAIIEVADEPEFYYTLCDTHVPFDIVIRISILCKGHVEDSKECYEVVDAVKKALIAGDTIGGTCSFSNILEVVYGDAIGEAKDLVAGAQILVRCRVD